MSTASFPLDQCESARTVRGLSRLLSPAPTLGLHSAYCLERGQVEQYVFDQFRVNHGATVRDFMPLLLTLNCYGTHTAAVGVRPAYEHDLLLEQYLAEPAEKALAGIVGQSINREQLVEIGNLVATQRGASQLLFLILIAVLHQAGHEWLVFTATPQVQKTIKRLGFELYDLCAATPEGLSTDRLADWGSYYDSQPRVVAGCLSEAMSVLANRKVYTRRIALYQNRIDTLATMIRHSNIRGHRHSFAA